MPTQPTPEQFQTLFEKAPPGPLIMLNLLKFKKRPNMPTVVRRTFQGPRPTEFMAP